MTLRPNQYPPTSSQLWVVCTPRVHQMLKGQMRDGAYPILGGHRVHAQGLPACHPPWDCVVPLQGIILLGTLLGLARPAASSFSSSRLFLLLLTPLPPPHASSISSSRLVLLLLTRLVTQKQRGPSHHTDGEHIAQCPEQPAATFLRRSCVWPGDATRWRGFGFGSLYRIEYKCKEG